MPDQTENTKVVFEQTPARLEALIKLDKPRASFTDIFESVSWLLSTMILFTWYNAIGELASRRGLDYAWVFDAHFYNFDRSIPLIPHFVFPYIAVYAMPAAFLWLCVRKYGYNMGIIRRFFAVQICMILCAFFFYYVFPTKTDLITNPVTGEIDVDISSTWVHRLNYSFVHQGISMWVAQPSMHCGHSSAIAFAFGMLDLPGKRIAQGLAVITLFSTIFCKPHTPPHLLQGVMLAWIVHHFLAKKMHATNALAGKYSWTMRMTLAIAFPVVLHMIGEYLGQLSGWKIDIPVMLGIDHRIPGGFKIGLYGF